MVIESCLMQQLDHVQSYDIEKFCVIIKPENDGDYQPVEYFRISPFVTRHLKSNIHLLHRTKYSIRIVSSTDYDAIARITINGEVIGSFYCHGQQATFIARPISVNKAFVFVSTESAIAVRSGSDVNVPEVGFIQVAIYPQDMNVPSMVYSLILFLVNHNLTQPPPRTPCQLLINMAQPAPRPTIMIQVIVWEPASHFTLL